MKVYKLIEKIHLQAKKSKSWICQIVIIIYFKKTKFHIIGKSNWYKVRGRKQ